MNPGGSIDELPIGWCRTRWATRWLQPSRLLEVEAVVEGPLFPSLGVPDAAIHDRQVAEIDMDRRGACVSHVDDRVNRVGRQGGHAGCLVIVSRAAHQRA